MKTVAIIKEVNETELVATWTPHDIEVKVGDWLEIKSEWQGLSDDEIRHLKYEYADYTLYDEGDGVCPEVELEVEEFARAIEQALKEKNHART